MTGLTAFLETHRKEQNRSFEFILITFRNHRGRVMRKNKKQIEGFIYPSSPPGGTDPKEEERIFEGPCFKSHDCYL
jgi:hypothetical protein